jgi:hypothetical protein
LAQAPEPLIRACRIDHVTVTCASLEQGSDMVHGCLGVRPQGGGEHPRMGTHNLLLRLGDTMFLEVIAVDRQAPPPARPRWFELDRVPPDGAPRLGCWVARTDDIHGSMAGASELLGVAEPMSRGSLEWLISIPQDGSLPLGGVAPALIQWRTATHPAMTLQDMGCSLVALELLHPEAPRLRALIASLRIAEAGVALSIREAPDPGLVARICTPHGLRSVGP